MNVNFAKFQKKFDSRTISRELPYPGRDLSNSWRATTQWGGGGGGGGGGGERQGAGEGREAGEERVRVKKAGIIC